MICIYPLYGLCIIIYPLVMLFRGLLWLVKKIFKAKEEDVILDEEDFQDIVESVEEQGLIEKEESEIIKQYCESCNKELTEDFMYIGDAHYRGNNFLGYDICGTSEEKVKVKALLNAIEQIKEYNELKIFMGQFQDLYFLPLIIKNEGDTFADDICVKISVPKECFFDVGELEIQGEKIADEVKDFISSVFLLKDNVDIEDMEQEYVQYPVYQPGLKLYNDDGPGLGYCQRYFEADISACYPYVCNIRGDRAIYKFKIGRGLNQFTAQVLSAQLMLKNEPEVIDYTITSKSFGYEITGCMKKF